MYVERDELVAAYLVQRFGAVTLAMSTRVHCFGEVTEAEARQANATRKPTGPRRNLHAVPARNVILGSDSEVDAPLP